MRGIQKILTAAAILVFGAAVVSAQQGTPATVTVTVSTKAQTAPPQIPANEVVVRQDDKVRPIISWVPAQGEHAGLDLVILVDDSLATRVSDRWTELQSFVRALPSGTRVAIAYANYGGTRFTQDFTTDHELAAKGFRIPAALPGSTNGIYDSVRSLIKKWPASQNRREIVLISSGIDLDNGVANSQPDLNLPLQNLINAAEHSGVVIYTIYATSVGADSNFEVVNGQGCLGRLAAETGGDAFFEGLNTPVSFLPYLDKIQKMLGQQYLLTFGAQPKSGDSRLKVTAESQAVQLTAPDHVRVPGLN